MFRAAAARGIVAAPLAKRLEFERLGGTRTMSQTFDDQTFAQLAWDARRLVEQAVHYERDLVSLVAAMDARSRDATPTMPELHHHAPGATVSVPPGSSSPPGSDLLPRVRQLCVAAREHRERAEEFAATLTGEPIAAGRRHDEREKVLVVDDAEDTRELAAIALAASGFRTVAAANGLEALLKAHSERPTVILMDINMPVLDGIEATRLLKATPATRHIHVIAHTAKAELLGGPAMRHFARVLRKPALPDELVASLKSFLAERREQGPDRSSNRT
jgi:two-component system cell cycle response regulator DivK